MSRILIRKMIFQSCFKRPVSQAQLEHCVAPLRRRALTIGIAGASALALATVASAQSPVVEYVHHSKSYPVEPLDPVAFLRSIQDQWRCVGVECKSGETKERMSWQYATVITSPTQCSITAVHLRVETTVTIPQWNAPPETSLARHEWWNGIQSEIARHEHRHVVIAEEAGRQLAADFETLTAPDCETLSKDAEDLARRARSQERDRQAAMDQEEGVMHMTAPPP